MAIKWAGLVAVALMLLVGCSKPAPEAKFCLVNGLMGPCSSQQHQQLMEQKKQRQHCQDQGLDWAGGQQCCPAGTRQMGCVANLPCRCVAKDESPTTP